MAKTPRTSSTPWCAAAAPFDLDLKVLVNYRDFHGSTHAGNWRMKIDPVENGVQVTAFDGATPFYLKCPGLVRAASRVVSQLFSAGRKRARPGRPGRPSVCGLVPGEVESRDERITFRGLHRSNRCARWRCLARERAATEAKLLNPGWPRMRKPPPSLPDWLPQLVLAADQFIVKRSLPEYPTVAASSPATTGSAIGDATR